MVINHNISALNTYNQMSKNEKATSSSLQKLSSGLRINSAADDAAGLAISQKMQAQINGLDQATSNAQNGISLVQTAEGALTETQSILQRMNTLATQSANGTMDASTDRTAMQAEVTQLNSEIDRIASTTSFNGTTLLNGSFGSQLDTTNSTAAAGTNGMTSIDVSGANANTTFTIDGSVAGKVTLKDGTTGDTQTVSLTDNTSGTLNFDKMGVKIGVDNTWSGTGIDAETVATTSSGTVNLQIGAQAGQTLAISIGDMTTAATGINTASVDISTATGASAAMTTIQTAIDKVSSQDGQLGAYENRLDHTINNLTTESENLQSASSNITDVDMAKEMMTYTKDNILNQAAQAMLAQANQLPQGVLQLLK